MATASPSILPPVNLNDNFSVTVTIVPGALEIVSSVSGVLSGSPSEPITVSSGTTSVTISGKHQNTFRKICLERFACFWKRNRKKTGSGSEFCGASR